MQTPTTFFKSSYHAFTLRVMRPSSRQHRFRQPSQITYSLDQLGSSITSANSVWILESMTYKMTKTRKHKIWTFWWSGISIDDSTIRVMYNQNKKFFPFRRFWYNHVVNRYLFSKFGALRQIWLWVRYTMTTNPLGKEFGTIADVTKRMFWKVTNPMPNRNSFGSGTNDCVRKQRKWSLWSYTSNLISPCRRITWNSGLNRMLNWRIRNNWLLVKFRYENIVWGRFSFGRNSRNDIKTRSGKWNILSNLWCIELVFFRTLHIAVSGITNIERVTTWPGSQMKPSPFCSTSTPIDRTIGHESRMKWSALPNKPERSWKPIDIDEFFWPPPVEKRRLSWDWFEKPSKKERS